MTTFNVLIFGASYGSLLATKLVLAGHDTRLICLPAEAETINRDGARVRLPVAGDTVEIDTRNAAGRLSAGGTAGVDPSTYDLVVLAMQEPQYGAAGVRELLDACGRARVPIMSISTPAARPTCRSCPS